MARSLDEDECDCVATFRSDRRGEPRLRSWFAKKFYSLINKVSDSQIVDGARDFRMMRKDMVDAIVAMGERNRFSKGIFGWVGFKTKWIEIHNTERVAGKTKWSFWSLFKYAIDGIISFSEVPLRFASWFGVFFTAISLLAILFIIIRWLCFGDPVAGWASTLCVIIFVGGIQLFCTGILGQYLAKTFSETKNRPHYIIADTNLEGIEHVS